jgi:1-phosphatidylinositol phosphodiesterase
MKRKDCRLIAIVAVAASLFFCAYNANAHDGGGYDHRNSAYPGVDNSDWLADLPDFLHISEISMVGTHDTYSDALDIGSWPENWAAHCQRMPLSEQLKSGIRMIDIRLNSSLRMGHGKFHFADFNSALMSCAAFLENHDQEAILMRVQTNWLGGGPDGDPEVLLSNFRDCIQEVYEDSTSYYDRWCWHPHESEDPTNPTLGEVRGKIVLLADYPFQGHGVSDTTLYGLQYNDSSMKIQDYSNIANVGMHGKWHRIRDHLDAAGEGDLETIYINYLSAASMGYFPFFVASGHLTYGTTSPHLWAGFVRWADHYLAKRVCFIWCTWWYYFDGMNELTYKYLINKKTERVGIIMADFPGPGLINTVIAVNDENRRVNAPNAVAGGPYKADEGTSITFDAGNSSDPNGDPILFRWDVDSDGEWETEWSSTPTTSYTWYDNFCAHEPGLLPPMHEDTVCVAQLEVSDETYTSGDAALVIISNVAPTVTIDDGMRPPGRCILPDQAVTFGAMVFDPGCLDSLSATWAFGDGAVSTQVATEDTICPAITRSVSSEHAFGEPGSYSVVLEVDDNDGGLGADTMAVRVLTALEAVECVNDFIQGLPESCFKGQAAQRKNALSNKLMAIMSSLEAGNTNGAIEKLLQDIRAKTDGSVDGHPDNDWIVCEEAQGDLCMILDELVRYLRSSTGKHSPGQPVAITDEGTPAAYSLSGNVPNPFSSATTIRFSLPRPAVYRLVILDAAGRIVRRYSKSAGPGEVSIVWDRLDRSGETVPSGVYFYRLETGEFKEARKMLVVP